MDNTENKSQTCKIVRKESFEICECIFSSDCEIEPIDKVVKKGYGYNIFTHRYENLFVHNNIIFHFCIVNDQIYFCNTNINEYVKNNEVNKEEAIKEEITKNFDFYKNINLEYNLNEEYIRIKDKYIMSKNLIIYDTENKRKNHFTFLLRKKFSIQQILDIYDEL